MQRKSVIPIVLILGAVGLSNMARTSRFESIRAVDMVQLVACGMCFGVALTLLLVRRRSGG